MKLINKTCTFLQNGFAFKGTHYIFFISSIIYTITSRPFIRKVVTYITHARQHITNTHNITSSICADFATVPETILATTSLHFPTFVLWRYPSHLTGGTTSYGSSNLIPIAGKEFYLLHPYLIYSECHRNNIREEKLFSSVCLISQVLRNSISSTCQSNFLRSQCYNICVRDTSQILTLPVKFKLSFASFYDTEGTVNFLCQRN